MHGVYKRPPYHPAAVGFGDDDAAFLRAHGFNTFGSMQPATATTSPRIPPS